MSSAADSPDGGMALQSHYSLRWNNHQAHILHAFEALLHAEILVDVTLVCAETSLRAHKVVLSVCSPFFERIFAEHPCKHPVIVLKDFTAREISALIDFMYRGEVRVGRDDLPNLIRAAESLQIRGLVASEPRPASPPETPTTDLLGPSPTPESAQLENQPRPLHEEELLAEDNEAPLLASSPLGRDRLPHMSHLNFSLRELRDICASPLMPRRKQARPRRRSGELVPQDLRRPHPSLSPSAAGLNLSSGHNSSNNSSQLDQSQQSPNQSQQREQQDQQQQQQQQEDVAESLSMKKEPKRSQSPSVASSADHMVKSESEAASSPRASPLTGSSLHPDGAFSELPSAGLAALSLTPPHHHSSEYLASLGQFAAQWLPPSHQNHLSAGGAGSQARHPRDDSPHGKPPGYPYQQAESPLAPRSAFPLDGMNPLGGGLFPHGGPLELHDGFKPDSFHNLFVGASLGHHHSPKKSKKHRNDALPGRWSDHSRGLPICRPKGQHSAPRGGPPRSWTNADLTEALTMVWNKKMTTSQASRVYGIPYNSLLMYVRGKYGKSLKLEQLRRDCAAGEVMNSLNNNVKPIEQPPPPSPRLAGLPALPAPHQPEPEAAAAANFAHHQLMAGGLGQGFFPDFNNFPMPVGMVHLLPPSEQKAFEPPTNPQPGQNSASNGLGSQQQQQQQPIRADDAMLSSSAGKSRSPSPMNAPGAASLQCDGLMPPPAQSAPALLQQNGSD